MVSSEVELCNLSLAKMGHEGFITSFTEGSKGARYMNVFYKPMRDAVIQGHLWRFARKRSVLAPLVERPPFDGGYYFQYPDDCLRIVGTDRTYFEQGERWKREGDRIIADTQTLNIVYLQRVSNVSLFDPMFVDTLSSRIAYEAALPITKSQSVKDQMEREYMRSLMRAARASATETDGERFISEAFIGVR
jgi:hypothetical protein